MLALAGSAVAAPTWRADVVIDHTAGTAPLVDHQVAVTLDGAALVAAGRMRPDAADLRFSDTLGAPLCHSIESGLDTSGTLVWVNVPAIPAHATVTIGVSFGDPGAASTDDPGCTFPFFEGFDAPSTRLAPLCGAVTADVDGGMLALSWSGSGLVASDVDFAADDLHVAEARVLATTGAWPGLYWMKTGSHVSYGLVTDASEARLGRTAVAGGDACFGHDWVSDALAHAGAAGTWRLVWRATGSLAASLPGVASLVTDDATWARDEPLRLVLGGVAAGSGSMLVDWVRTRRYTATPPLVSVTNLRHGCTDAPALCDDGDACTLDACDPLTGCGHTPRRCDDDDACTVDACDADVGCVVTPVTCDDGNACTVDVCDPALGCSTTSLGCDDGDACTDDVCDPVGGCAHAPVRGATFHGVGCALGALRTSVEAPRTDPVPAVVTRLLDEASRQTARAVSLVDAGRRPQAVRRLRQTAIALSRLARRLRRLAARGTIAPITATAWAADAEALAAAVTALRDGLR